MLISFWILPSDTNHLTSALAVRPKRRRGELAGSEVDAGGGTGTEGQLRDRNTCCYLIGLISTLILRDSSLNLTKILLILTLDTHISMNKYEFNDLFFIKHCLTEVVIYKRKQECKKKERKHVLDQEYDQENGQEKRKF